MCPRIVLTCCGTAVRGARGHRYSQSQPNVLVFSYAGPELGATNASAFLETSLEALGAMGISVLASSGDTGAFWPTTRAEETCNSMAALYPASSPCVGLVVVRRLGCSPQSGYQRGGRLLPGMSLPLEAPRPR